MSKTEKQIEVVPVSAMATGIPGSFLFNYDVDKSDYMSAKKGIN